MKAYIQLLRLPNIITSLADALAGALIASTANPPEFMCLPLWLILISSALLYGGGVALNDVADAKEDLKERPERPIPSGRIARQKAARLAWLLMCAGVAAAGMTGLYSLLTSLMLFMAIILYNLKFKAMPYAGSINMGLCRSLNFCLGLSLVPDQMGKFLILAIFPLIHTMSVTLLSQGEAAGLSRHRLFIPSLGPCIIMISLIVMAFQFHRPVFSALVFIMLYIAGSALAFVPAILHPDAAVVRRGVKYGILSLVLLEAALVGIFTGGIGAIFTGFLVIISWLLSNWFAMA